MNEERLRSLLEDFRLGKLPTERMMELLQQTATETTAFASLDHHRELRQGFPEVIFCEGKTTGQVAALAMRIQLKGSVMLATRASLTHFTAVKRRVRDARYFRKARIILANERYIVERGVGTILVVTAGTSDIPVAEEALITARAMGNKAELLVDVGVAGIHRLMENMDVLRKASVIIVVAGMEGALASVVGGLVSVPVIAVPTSIGYGANFGGIAALLGMLNSCAAGVTVVNIDNGFGAAAAASIFNRRKGL